MGVSRVLLERMGGPSQARDERASADLPAHETQALGFCIRPRDCPDRDTQPVSEFAVGGQPIAGPQPAVVDVVRKRLKRSPDSGGRAVFRESGTKLS